MPGTNLLPGLLSGVLLLLAACNDSPFPPEQVTKTRPIGVATTPIGLRPGSSAVLDLHLATPLATDLTVPQVALYFANESGGNQVINATASVSKVADFAALSHQIVSLAFTVPPPEALAPAADGTPIFYALVVRDDTQQREIPITGKALVYPEDHPASAYQNPSLTITQPGATVGNDTETPLVADLVAPTADAYKMGWLVPHGRVQNRRALATKWHPEGTGTYTMIVTARGRKTQTFAVAFHDIVVQ